MKKGSLLANLDEALMRAGGAQRISGNRVRLLKDAGENYPAWIGNNSYMWSYAINAALMTVGFRMRTRWTQKGPSLRREPGRRLATLLIPCIADMPATFCFQILRKSSSCPLHKSSDPY
jgi:hypothetical protein